MPFVRTILKTEFRREHLKVVVFEHVERERDTKIKKIKKYKKS